jgi:hypothetical protein
VDAKGCLSFINTTLRSILEASHSKTKVLSNSGIANTGVVHMESLKETKSYAAFSLQTNEFLLRSEVREVAIFP